MSRRPSLAQTIHEGPGRNFLKCELAKKNFRVNINGSRFTNLRFANDIILFAQSPIQLQEMLQKLYALSKSSSGV